MNGNNNPPPKRPQNMNRPQFPDRSASRQTKTVPYSAEEQERIQSQLNKVLGPEYVSFRPGGGGQNVSYIEGWKALNLANEIFGFNGWSSELINIQVDFLDSLGSGRVSLGLSVVVRITIRDGTFHEDFGYGFLENAKNKAVAFEKCKKEAFTDALKRCLRCFGNVLGNCLYDKSIVAKMQKVKLPPPELESDDFHRDPLLAKQELARQRMRRETTRASIPATSELSKTNSMGQTRTRPPDTPSASNGNSASYTASTPAPLQPSKNPQGSVAGRSLTPVEVGKYDLDDFDDSFVFSDDLPVDPEDEDVEMKEEQKSDVVDEKDTAEQSNPPMPAQVFFTSSKKALDIQKTPNKSDVPVYDHKFVAEGVKRSVDPTKSTKIRRADLPSPFSASQINSSRLSISNGPPGLGKRQLGLPQSQRLQTKRPHRDSDQSGKENEDSTMTPGDDS